MSKLTAEAFMSDVSSHAMEVILDEGVYRHIRFSKPGTMYMHFDLITWPGHLCCTGDMGTYVFSRLNDMFEFFRTDRECRGELAINKGYWSEKLLAVDGGRRSGGATEFSEEKFTQVINDYVASWLEGSEVDEEAAEELREAVQDEIISMIEPSDEGYSYRLANDFTHDVDGEKFQFEDLWDYDFTDYTRSFVWCCYALTWGISQYDMISGGSE